MAIISFVDQINVTGNFDEVINDNIITSFALNVAQEGVNITSNTTPIVTTIHDFNTLITAVNVWRVLVNVAFNMPLVNPIDYSSKYTQSSDLTESEFSVLTNTFFMTEENSTGILTVSPIRSCFLSWGEFNMYLALNRQFISYCFNISQVPN